MAWTDPRDWTTGEVVTAAIMTTHVRDNLRMTAPHIVTTAGDIVYATGDSALQRLALGSSGYILHVSGSAPAWTNSPSISGIALSGVLDANGSIDFDGTTAAFDASGAVTVTSTSSSANGIYLRANGGTSETIKIHADQGTSVTEGAASVSMLSDAGGVELRSTANLANAINITNDGGTSGTITIFNDQGTSVTEGAASIALVSDAGGVELRSTANLANAINITNDGGTTGTITIFNDQGTSVTEGAASIQMLSDAGGIGIKSTANLASAILLTADGGTSETIVVHSDQGSGAGSITLLSDAGGITLNANGAVAVTNDLTVGGDLTVSGDTTTVNTATLSVEDPLIILASGNNAADALDIGFYGLYDTSGSQDLYAGLFRDANDSGKWKLFKDNQAAPTTTVNVSGTGYTVATLVADIEAGSVKVDNITIDGTEIDLSSGSLTIDVAANIELDSGTGIWTFEDTGTEVLRLTESNSGDVTVKLVTNAKDLIFTDNGDAAGLTIKDAQGGIIVPGEVMTTKLSYTDGDDALTIADGGGLTVAQNMTMADGASIILDAEPGTDHYATGIIASMQAGEAISAFELVYIHSDGDLMKADASATGTMPAIGIATAAISDTAYGNILLRGFVRDDTWNWTPGGRLYVSETAGAITQTAPSDDGDFIQVVGIALTADIGYFTFDTTTIESAG